MVWAKLSYLQLIPFTLLNDAKYYIISIFIIIWIKYTKQPPYCCKILDFMLYLIGFGRFFRIVWPILITLGHLMLRNIIKFKILVRNLNSAKRFFTKWKITSRLFKLRLNLLVRKHPCLSNAGFGSLPNADQVDPAEGSLGLSRFWQWGLLGLPGSRLSSWESCRHSWWHGRWNVRYVLCR